MISPIDSDYAIIESITYRGQSQPTCQSIQNHGTPAEKYQLFIYISTSSIDLNRPSTLLYNETAGFICQGATSKCCLYKRSEMLF
jgi:hypothetical protein